MPRGIRNPKPEIQEVPIEAQAERPEWTPPQMATLPATLGVLEAMANNVELPAHERLFAMQEIARIRANG